jgi:hypothetical protein
MRSLSQEKVWTFSDENGDGGWGKCPSRDQAGTEVVSYQDLASKVAALQFHNPNYVLMFRGQTEDFRLPENGNSTIRPSIFRRDEKYSSHEWNDLVRRRYEVLHEAENLLLQRWPTNEGKRRLLRSVVIKWAILQHYEVCDTPLLDVTHSLRIAASFGSMRNVTEESYLMVLAVPQISGAVSSCAYHEIQTLRLSSLCPPSAKRPHLQEGYLIGEYPELRSFEEKMELALHETDFGQRLIGKFKFNPKTFWSSGIFPMIPEQALYPNKGDLLFDVCSRIKSDLEKKFPSHTP